jgi:hypothetical protein
MTLITRLVRGVERDGSEGVVALCNPGHQWSPRLVSEVVADIESRQYRYAVELPPNDDTTIFVVRPLGGVPHLRTGPDDTAADNLGALPECDEVPEETDEQWSPPVRRNVAEVDQEERDRLRDAILALFDRFSSTDDPVNLWFKQDQIHQATHVHDVPSFLPWHRELVNQFEAALQQVDPGIALHYWDWTTDPRHTPDGHGGFVDLMAPDFMGSPEGLLGPPLVACYNEGQPAGMARDEALAKQRPAPFNATRPPRSVVRAVVSSGRTPHNARLDDYDLSAFPPGHRPHSDDDVRVKNDEDVLWPAFQVKYPLEFEYLWRSLSVAHGWAHAYLGGDIGKDPGSTAAQHTSFRDPFVFLLHSNLDRLWASWQLRPDKFDQRTWSPRLDPALVYGALAQGEGEFADDDDNERPFHRAQAQRELTEPMPPWNGTGNIKPWSDHPIERTAQDPEVVRPPLYDRYTWQQDRLCMSWPALFLARRLSMGDVIEASVTLDAVPAGNVEFLLKSGPRVHSWKGLRVPDGEDPETSWLIETDGNKKSDSVTLWAHQVHHGQQLIFHHWYAGVLGIGAGKRVHYRLGDLGWILPGSRVTFTWLRD